MGVRGYQPLEDESQKLVEYPDGGVEDANLSTVLWACTPMRIYYSLPMGGFLASQFMMMRDCSKAFPLTCP